MRLVTNYNKRKRKVDWNMDIVYGMKFGKPENTERNRKS